MRRAFWTSCWIYSCITALLFPPSTFASYTCDYSCSSDPLEQIYPSQNMCVLMALIPPSLQGLSYGMYPTCDIYYTNRFSYNKRLNWFPLAIFTPSTVTEVQYVLGQLISNKLPFYVRSGGHSYEQVIPFGTIIDLCNLNSIVPDTSTNTVYLGAGCRLGDVISALGALDYAIPTGTCPSVGLSGLALGGGIGLLVRQFGLTCDSILSMEVLNADNQLITVSADSYPDLFWALRGAGHNSFGIVLGYTFKMYYLPTVSLLQLRWNWNPEVFSTVYNAWQQWVTTLPATISSETVFKYNQDGTVRLSVNALKIGAEPFTEWEAVFQPLNPTTTGLYIGDYLGAADLFASNYTYPFSKTKSKMFFKPLPQDGVNALINWMAILQNVNCSYEAFWGIGAGNLGAIAATDTAYFPRKAFGWAFGFIYWPFSFQDTQALNLINEAYNALAPYTSPYSYANLTDYALGASYLKAYYGSNVARLVQIKNTYDPQNVFSWHQGIPLYVTPTAPLTEQIQDKYCGRR